MRLSERLGLMVLVDQARTGNKYDGVIVVARGGSEPGNNVARLMGFDAIAWQGVSLSSYVKGKPGVKYTQEELDELAAQGFTVRDKFVFGQTPDDIHVVGNRLLVIDEVCDSGLTHSILEKYLLERGARAVDTAVLHYKPTKTETGFVPKYYAEYRQNGWLHYQWEMFDHYWQKALGTHITHEQIIGFIAKLLAQADPSYLPAFTTPDADHQPAVAEQA